MRTNRKDRCNLYLLSLFFPEVFLFFLDVFPQAHSFYLVFLLVLCVPWRSCDQRSHPLYYIQCGKYCNRYLKWQQKNPKKLIIACFFASILIQSSAIIPRSNITLYCRADSRFALIQWEMALLCNDVSHWLGASLESALYYKRYCSDCNRT